MTMERILELAYFAALDNWCQANERLRKMPGNRLAKSREERRSRELEEVQRIRRALMESEKPT